VFVPGITEGSRDGVGVGCVVGRTGIGKGDGQLSGVFVHLESSSDPSAQSIIPLQRLSPSIQPP